MCAASRPLGKAIQTPAATVVVERSIPISVPRHGEFLSLIFTKSTDGTSLNARISAEIVSTELLILADTA